jgi:hypothetical protein
MEARLAAILKVVADTLDQTANPGKFDARNAIHDAIYDQSYLETFLTIWERNGEGAARAYDSDLNDLYSAAMRAAFPDGDSMRFVSGDDLRARVSLIT